MTTTALTRKLLAILAVFVLLVGTTGVVSAQTDTPFGGAITVEAGETHEGDLRVAGGSVVVAGTVDGSLQVAAGRVVVTDTGRVTGDVAAAAGSVTIDGAVDGDVSVGTASLVVGDAAVVGGSLEAGAADARIDGTVAGDVTVGADTFVVGPGADIGGDVVYDAGTVTVSEEATVGGTVTRDDTLGQTAPVFDGRSGATSAVSTALVALYGFFANLVLGALLLAVAPGFARRVTDVATTEAAKSAGVGLLALVGVPVVLVLLVVTVVGIPLSVAGFAAFGLVLWAAAVYGALVLGTWLLSLADYDQRWVALFVGVFLVSLAGLLPFGGVVQFAALVVGLGAFALALRDRMPDDDEGGDATVREEPPTEGSQPV
ncbi:Polymer-forming protein [Halopelagius inordinatus]|uniref:Polymer-forming protein n=1 Tax=Halopelagius inordinatus TaxID=553467 RepID=A0A1I2NZ34_9EURY|nr:polymer-forming cytoskeletal protein [Halopelagius inordinatus]SFG08089.1 Polymer-forming protein [Halopelagius inordinatus]